MANLSSLVHELRERIAASSSTPPNKLNDDALETRFRAVLPNLLHAYVVPSPSAKEREVMAILKLLAHTANNFAGVFYHGKASAVLPIIGRILPFFAEPAFRSRHAAIFQTLGSLLSLLRTGDRDAYRLFFMDTMSLVEDILYIASLCDKENSQECRKVSLKCYCESFAGVCNDPLLLSDLPACNKPAHGYGILINLTSKKRWQPFAASVIKLLCKCLTEGTIYVEGLLDASCVWSACNLLCYGDADLHMACFDFARVVGTVVSYEIVPTEKVIGSISIILSKDGAGLPIFRDAVYDSSIGGCLHALHSSCTDDIVRSTASDLVNVFFESLLKTRSSDLKAALCSAYVRIARSCPPRVWKPESLIPMLCSSRPILQLIECFQVALFRLGHDFVGEGTANNGKMDFSTSSNYGYESSRVGEKRPILQVDALNSKRQRRDDGVKDSSTNCQDVNKLNYISVGEKEYADYMRSSLSMFVELLRPPDGKDDPLRPEVALTALSTLCIVFCEYPHANLSICVFRLMCEWVPWICEQVKQGLPTALDLSIFLVAVHSLLLIQGFLPMKNQLLKNSESADPIRLLLEYPWIDSLGIPEHHLPWMGKCLSIQVFSKIALMLQNGNDHDILGLGLHDEAQEVRIEAVSSMPMIVLWSGFGFLRDIFKKLV